MFQKPPTAPDALVGAIERLRTAVEQVHTAGSWEGMDDRELVSVLAHAGAALRGIESVIVMATDAVETRSAAGFVDERLTTRFGCASVVELLQRATGVSGRSAGSWRRAARAVHRERGLSDGALLDGDYPALAAALADGAIGVDALLSAVGPLSTGGARLSADDRLLADEALAHVARLGDGSWVPAAEMRAALAAERVALTGDEESATGDAVGVRVPACADTVRIHAAAWIAALDPDGAEPQERQALRGRELSLGAVSGGLVPLRGRLLPEIAAQLQRVLDASLTPRFTGPRVGRDGEATDAVGDEAGEASAVSARRTVVAFRPTTDADGDCPDSEACACDGRIPRDDRTTAQKRHDAFATALFAAAASQSLPTIGAAAPTLVVTVRASDLAAGTGFGFAAETDEPLPIGAAQHIACVGAVQRVVLSETGRITHISSEERVFDRHQRRAIAARDGGCVIPGCHVPAAWCEIHHVTEHARGGATHTDNGVMLCWFHHRHLDRHGWQVRMRDGIPEVRPPSWFDASGHWRSVTRSRVRLAEAAARRRHRRRADRAADPWNLDVFDEN